MDESEIKKVFLEIFGDIQLTEEEALEALLHLADLFGVQLEDIDWLDE